jgi:hypothetical protein
MAAFEGWIIIAAVLGLLSAALLWPGFLLLRRLRPAAKGWWWSYAAATLACAVALWYLIPLLVWTLFGHHAH